MRCTTTTASSPTSPSARDGAQAAARMAKLEKKGRDLARRHRGPHDRRDLLGQGVVRQPRTLQRLSPTGCRAAGPTCATARWSTCRSDRARSRRWSAARALRRRGDVARGAASRAGTPSAAIARARSTRSWSSCRDASRRASWTRICEREDGLFPAPKEISFTAVVRTGRRCASTSLRCCTASARASIISRSCSSRSARSIRRT